jgi:hypothetical protein
MKRIFFFLLTISFIGSMLATAHADYQGTIGTRYTISGAGFGSSKSKVYLLNGSKQVQAKVESWSDSSITCLWTTKMSPGTYSLFVLPKGKGVAPISVGTFSIKNPIIDSVIPWSASVNEIISIDGRYFSNKKPKLYLEDPISLKKISCKVNSFSMDQGTGKSALQFQVPKTGFNNHNIILQNQIGQIKFSKPEIEQTIGPEGGVIEVTDSSSSLYGVKVEIPEGALSNSTSISISKETVPPTTSGLILLSSIIKLGPEGTQFNSPIKINLPYNKSGLSTNDLISPFVYSETQSYWYIPIVTSIDQTKEQIEILTTHFSDRVVANYSGTISLPDTGFRPDMNGFNIPNNNKCGGLAGFAQWFYVNHRNCNNLFSIDEQTANQIADIAQTHTKETKQWTWQDFKNKTRGKLPWSWFVNAVKHEMSETNNSPVIIAKITQSNNSDPTGHASLAYRFDDAGVLAYDPSNPGTERIITENEYNDPNSDYIVWHASELYNPDDFNSIFETYKAILCSECPNIAGSWHFTNSGVVTCNGETEYPSGSGTINITQSGCNVSWTDPVYNQYRSGPVSGNTINVSGNFAVPLVEGVHFTQNTYSASGTISEDTKTINLNGKGSATGSYEGMNFSCKGTDTATFTRSSSSSLSSNIYQKEFKKRQPKLFLNNSLRILTIAD